MLYPSAGSINPVLLFRVRVTHTTVVIPTIISLCDPQWVSRDTPRDTPRDPLFRYTDYKLINLFLFVLSVDFSRHLSRARVPDEQMLICKKCNHLSDDLVREHWLHYAHVHAAHCTQDRAMHVQIITPILTHTARAGIIGPITTAHHTTWVFVCKTSSTAKISCGSKSSFRLSLRVSV